MHSGIETCFVVCCLQFTFAQGFLGQGAILKGIFYKIHHARHKRIPSSESASASVQLQMQVLQIFHRPLIYYVPVYSFRHKYKISVLVFLHNRAAHVVHCNSLTIFSKYFYCVTIVQEKAQSLLLLL